MSGKIKYIRIVTRARVLGPYVSEVEFSDGMRRRVDSSYLLEGEIFRPLRDPDFFAQMRVDPEIDTVTWPNGADIAPETMYEAGDRVNLTPYESAAPLPGSQVGPPLRR
jgi:hypothetical protein